MAVWNLIWGACVGICFVGISLSAPANQSGAEDRHEVPYKEMPNDQYNVVCYYPNYAQHRNHGHEEGKYEVDDIDASLCNYIHYAFAHIKNLRLETTEPRDIRNYVKVNELKLSNPNLKTLLTVGGATHDESEWHKVIQSDFTMDRFIGNCINYVRLFGFDGIDLDWEFPETPDEIPKFTELLRRFRLRIIQDSEGRHREQLLLSAALGTSPNIYEVSTISEYIDYANVMTYHLHDSGKGVTGLHSALKSVQYQPLSQESVVNDYERQGFPLDKLVLGVPTFGISFTLSSPSQHDAGDPISGPGPLSNYTKEEGIMTYYEICMGLKKNDWTGKYEKPQEGAYAYSGRYWVGYENPRSIEEKSTFVRERQLAGIFFWDMSMDDFNNLCRDGSYPLLNAAQPPRGSTTRSVPTTTRQPHTTTPDPPTLPECRFNGQYIPYPGNCSLFYQCSRDSYPQLFMCPAPLHFDPVLEVCKYPDEAICKDRNTPRCTQNGQLLPHPADCSLFYRCVGEDRTLLSCTSPLHFNPGMNRCDMPNPDVCVTSVNLAVLVTRTDEDMTIKH